MKIVIPVFLLLTGISSYAQKTEKMYDYNWVETTDPGRGRFYSIVEKKDSLWLRKDFFIREQKLQMQGSYRDKESKIEEGTFYYYHANGQLEGTGNYVNGKKQGLWLNYYDNGMMQDSIVYENGNVIGTSLSWHRNGYLADSAVYNADGSGMRISWFDNGNPSSAGVYSAGRKLYGKWKFFHKTGELSAEEVYQNDKLVSRQYYDEQGKPISDTTNRDREASFPGGGKAWLRYLEKNLSFPPQWKIEGADAVIVTVDWIIDEEGKVTNVFVSSPFHPDFDKIALDIIRRSPKWIPAISHNRTVKVGRRQPVTFAQ